MSFENRVVAITGACSGIGKMLCEEFLKAGAIVNRFDVNQEVLKESCTGYHDYVVDVSDYENVQSAMNDILGKHQKIDIVINCAGGASTRVFKENVSFEKLSLEAINWGIDVNLKGPFYFAHAVLKQMREQEGGLIINIGSITGQEGDPYGMDYPTSKAGLMFGLTKSIAQYGSKYGIRCVCVSPGPVMTRAAMANMKTLLGRAAEPQEIIDLCLFIASDKGQFINGENIMIDGGRNAMSRWK